MLKSFLKISLFVVLFGMSMFYSCSTNDSTKNDTYSSALKDFQNPPPEYSTAPFWVWNYIITKPMIDEQLNLFKEIGVNQVIIHPRPGLVTEYLSNEWFDMIKYSVDVAKKLNMKIMLYDENSYPSGFGGGHVPAELPDVMIKYLNLTKTSRPDTIKNKFVVLERKGDEFKIADSTNYSKDIIYYTYYFEPKQKMDWFAGYTYVDVLQKKTTMKFIETTHEKYKKAIGNEFGKTVLGLFTDEPSPDFRQTLYTPAIFEEFQKKYGYDLKINLPSLIEEVGDYKKVRHDTYNLLISIFVENWAKPYSEWCEKNNLPMTGHYWEHAWGAFSLGPDNIAMNYYSQIPGIDVLMNRFNNSLGGQFGNDMMVRETKSAANQNGRARLLSETYGAAGWDLTFQDMKRIGDWEYALGVNLMNQHLCWGSITGYRKYDHPPSFSYHAPYFKNYKILADYYSRLSAALSKGVQNNKVLLLEPTTSIGMYWRQRLDGANYKFIDSMVMTSVRSMHKLTHELEVAHVGYDIGSEWLIDEYGKITGNILEVNKGSYSLFILPPYTENLDSKTVTLLENFLKNGGKVLSTKSLPSYVDGSKNDKIVKLAESNKSNWLMADSIAYQDINNICQQPVTFSIQSGGDKLYHMRKELKDAQLIFISNADELLESKGSMETKSGSLEEWDLFTGTVKPYPFKNNGEKISTDFNLPPGGSLLLCIKSEKSEPVKPQNFKVEKIAFSEDLKIEKLSKNTLTIDFCDLRIKGESIKDMYFYDAQKKIFNTYGFTQNPWMGIQFKSLLIDTNKFDAGSGFEADYKFTVDKGVDLSTLQAAYERPQFFKLKINGNQVEPIKDKYFVDKDFAVYDISKFVKTGMNIVTVISKPMNILSELDRLYILGEFSLESQKIGFKLTAPKKLQLGDWTKQGLPLYADKVAYERSVNIQNKTGNYFVKLPEWKGTCAEVFVNNTYAGLIAFNPYELDVTKYIQTGKNNIKIVVVSSLRNLLGPHHTKDAIGQTWPGHFFSVRKEEGFTIAGDSYFVTPYGLMKDFELYQKQ